jgi:hypothetical protein
MAPLRILSDLSPGRHGPDCGRMTPLPKNGRVLLMKSAMIGIVLMGLGMTAGPAVASPLTFDRALSAQSPALEAQYNPRSPTFRRCMRAKYGPRYFAGVRRAHRWHMAQACTA